MNMHTPNPRAIIGNNACPSLIDLAKPTITELGSFLNDYPVITNDDESRKAKEIFDRVTTTLKAIEDERDGKVRPLNDQVREINEGYHHVHNVNDKKPGIWDTLLRELRIRLSAFARAEELKRLAAAAAARAILEAAEAKARTAEAREREAAQDAAQGVCDVDFAGATEQADTAFSDFQRASRLAARAQRDTKVRIVGGANNAISLRNHEILTVTDWKAAIEEMGLTDDIRDAILKSARSYKRNFNELPAGITSTFDRSL